MHVGARRQVDPLAGRKTYLDMKYDSTTVLGPRLGRLIEVRDAYDWDPADPAAGRPETSGARRRSAALVGDAREASGTTSTWRFRGCRAGRGGLVAAGGAQTGRRSGSRLGRAGSAPVGVRRQLLSLAAGPMVNRAPCSTACDVDRLNRVQVRRSLVYCARWGMTPSASSKLSTNPSAETNTPLRCNK